MTAWLKARLSSLGWHLLLPLCVAIGVVLTVHAFLSFRSTEEDFHRFVTVEADRSSGLIRRATHDGMLLNRKDELQATLESLSESPAIAAVRVYDKAGTIVMSSSPGEVGRSVPVGVAPCTSCHTEGLRIEDAAGASESVRADGQSVIRQLSVIVNEPGCTVAGCHDLAVGKPILGVLEVEMSMLPLDEALASARTQLIRTTLLLLLAIGVLTTLFFRRLVYRPIRLLQEGARRIAQGDLSTRIEVAGVHELASLARDFNQMARDLTGLRAELTEWSEDLEQKVAEKTSELRAAQGQVLHMEKMASLGKLSATVAHEINNPISGVLTYSRLIERELANQPMEPEIRKELERYLDLVQQECSRCGQIAKSLLVFARRSGTELVPTDMKEVIERSLMLVRHHLEIGGVVLRIELPETGTEIVADPGQIEQALVALLVNAAEAMPQGGALLVRLSTHPDEVEIEVADTGTGIEPDALAHVFEPFFSTKLDKTGVGLGLAVVYGIVQRHGGTIGIDSALDRGTTVRMRLPRTPTATDEDGAVLSRPVRSLPAAPVASSGGREDDN